MSKMLIHFGFQQLYMELREDIQTTLRSLALLYPDYRIVFAGMYTLSATFFDPFRPLFRVCSCFDCSC